MNLFKDLWSYWNIEDKPRLHKKSDFELGRSRFITHRRANMLYVAITLFVIVFETAIILLGML